jgi:dCTP deaminase
VSFLSGEALLAAIPKYDMIRPFYPSQIDCASYTLKMGREAYITPDYQVQDLSRHRIEVLTAHEHFIIPAGQFAFLLTEEIINIPDHIVGFISLKTGVKFRGLINVSGFHVDPGFQGHLLYAVYNAGPSQIHLARGMDIFLIWFAMLDRHSESIRRNLSPIENQHINPSLIENIPGEIFSLQSLSRKIDDLSREIDRKTDELSRGVDRLNSRIGTIWTVFGASGVIIALILAALQINWKDLLGLH